MLLSSVAVHITVQSVWCCCTLYCAISMMLLSSVAVHITVQSVWCCCTHYCVISMMLLSSVDVHITVQSVWCCCPVWLYTLLCNQYDVWKKELLNIKCVSIFSITFVWNKTHGYIFIHVHPSSCNVRNFYHMLFELEYSLQILKKSKIYQISWKSVRCDRSFSMRTAKRTDDRRRTNNSHFSQFYECTWKGMSNSWRQTIAIQTSRYTEL